MKRLINAIKHFGFGLKKLFRADPTRIFSFFFPQFAKKMQIICFGLAWSNLFIILGTWNAIVYLDQLISSLAPFSWGNWEDQGYEERPHWFGYEEGCCGVWDFGSKWLDSVVPTAPSGHEPDAGRGEISYQTKIKDLIKDIIGTHKTYLAWRIRHNHC